MAEDFSRLDFVVLKEDFVGKRLDIVCCKVFNYSRNFIQKLFLKGNIFVNGLSANKKYKVKFEDKIKLYIPRFEEFDIIKQNLEIDIVYEDEDLLVVNKKRGMVVHPAPGHSDGTLVNALMWHCKEKLSSIGGVLRPGIVHRIDKNTTGLLVVAKTDAAYKSLSIQIKDHLIVREYEAIVHGRFNRKKGLIDLNIGRSLRNRKKMAVDFLNGKRALTYYEVLHEYKNFTLLRLRLNTGRTHQIRVHMAYIGHPVAGDELYGMRSDIRYGLDKGQCLHSKRLVFYHYRFMREFCFVGESDEYFLNFLNKCQKEI